MKKVVLIISLLMIPCSVHAETIILKSGRIIKGKIIHKTPIYIRLEPRFLGDPDREFLVENVSKIIEGDDDYVPAQDVLNYVSSPDLQNVPENVQKAARKMAASLLEQAMRDVQMPNLKDAPANVKLMAEEKATDLLAQAMSSLRETPDNVKDAAREIANSLLEETVRTTDVDSIDQVPSDVKQAAQKKASALIEQAMVDSVEEAPNQVKLAAQLKARALIEDAMREVNILEGVIGEGQSVQQDYELSSIIKRNKQLERKQITTFNREIPDSQIDAMMDEAVQRRVESVTKDDAFSTVAGTNGMVEEMVIPEVVPEEVPDAAQDEEVIIDIPIDDDIVVLSQEELNKKIAAIPQPKMKGLSFKDFLFALSYRDFIGMGACIVLLFILLGQRARSRKDKGETQEQQDIQVVSSVTFQHLPDDIKPKFTSSEISLIIDLEDKYRQKSDKSSEETLIDDKDLIKFIQENATKSGSHFTAEDLIKVLETKEQTITETGLA